MSSTRKPKRASDAKKSLAAPTRRLSPAEFQIFVAAHTLDKPTIHEVREFLAQLPPLSISLRRTKSPANASRGAMPSYNTVNTLLLRMLASGAVALEDQEDAVARRIVPLWDFEQTLTHTIELTLRDYLAWKPLLPRILEIVAAQTAESLSPKQRSELRAAAHRALGAAQKRSEIAEPALARAPNSKKRKA